MIRSKESKRALSYARRMITKGTWQVQSRIPSIKSIAETIGVSYPTVRKAIKVLEDEGIIENWGSLGFIVISNKIANFKKNEKNKYYVGALKNNIKIIKLLSKDGIFIGRYAIRYIPASDNIVAIDSISGKVEKASKEELMEIVSRPIELEALLKTYKKKPIVYHEQRKKYDRQKKIRPLAHLVFRHKKELGIHGE